MGSTLANMSIGIVGDVGGFRGPVEAAIGVTERFARTVNGVLVPASLATGMASNNAAAGVGNLEQILEVLSLRIMSTSGAVSRLSNNVERTLRANGRLSQSSATVTESITREARATESLDQVRSRLFSQVRTGVRQDSALRLIDEGTERASLRRIFEEAEVLRRQSQVQGGLDRVGGLDSQIADLRRQRASVDPFTGAGPSQRQIDQQINDLLQQRTTLMDQLTRDGEQSVDLAQQQYTNEQQITAAIRQRRGAIQGELAEFARRGNENLAGGPPAPSQNMQGMQSELAQLSRDIRTAANEENRFYQYAEQATDSLEDQRRAIDGADAARTRRIALQNRSLEVARQIGQVEADGVGVRERIARTLEDERAALDQVRRARLNISRSVRAYETELQRAVALQQISVAEAENLARVYREQVFANYQRGTQAVQQQAGGIGRMGFAVQQLGYGVEDFVSQLGTRGLAGAFGAASNNLTAMVAQTQNLRATLFASLGVSVIQLAVQTGLAREAMAYFAGEMHDVSERTKDLTKNYDLAADASLRLLDHQKNLADITDLGTGKAAASRTEAMTRDIERQKIELGRLSEAARDFADRKRLPELDSQISSTIASNFEATDEQKFLNEAKINALKKERAEIAQRISDRSSEEVKTQTELKAATERKLLAEKELLALQQRRVELQQAELKAALAEREDLYVGRQQAGAGQRFDANGKERIFTERELLRVRRERDTLDRQQLSLFSQQMVTLDPDRRLELMERQNELAREALQLTEEETKLLGEGFKERRAAEDAYKGRLGDLNEEFQKEQQKAEEAERFADALERAQQSGAVTKQEAELATQAYARLGDMQDERERLLEEKKKLKERASQFASAPQVQNAVTAGSAEAGKIVAQARLDQLNQATINPIAKALEQNQTALEAIEQAVKGIPVLNLKGA